MIALQPSRRALAALAFVLCAALPACDEGVDPAVVGGACEVLPETFNAEGVAIQIPTLECSSRYCIAVRSDDTPAVGKTVNGNCAEQCDSDAECEEAVGPGCLNGFVCATPTVEGPFCCRKFCVCRDDLDQLPPNQPTPDGCYPDDPAGPTCPDPVVEI